MVFIIVVCLVFMQECKFWTHNNHGSSNATCYLKTAVAETQTSERYAPR